MKKCFTRTLKLVKNNSFFKKNNLVCGFTLLELLVVIAIIGVLATIVMASVNNARGKAKITAIQSDARSLVNEINLQISSNIALGEWSGIACPTTLGTSMTIMNQKMLDILSHAKSQGNGFARCYFDTASNEWSIAIDYSTNDKFWCIDSNGKSKEEPGGSTTTYGNGMIGQLCL